MGTNNKSKHILSLSMNPSIDRSSSVEQMVAGRKLYFKPPALAPGGSGVNVSRAVKKLGGDSRLLCLSGGATGGTLEELLRGEGIDYRTVRIKNATRENLTVLEEATGRQYRFGTPGPVVSEIEWRSFLAELGGIEPAPEYVVASGSLPPGVPADLYAYVARICMNRGSKVIIDAPNENLKPALKEGVFLIKTDLLEFNELAGRRIEPENEFVEKAKTLVGGRKSEVLVVSLGPAGAVLASNRTSVHIKAPAVSVVSEAGAGDSLVAGIALGLARGMPVSEAVRFGIAAGTAAVMTPGSELCRKEDAERLYREMPGYGSAEPYALPKSRPGM